MKKNFIRIICFLGGFALIATLIYISTVPSLQKLKEGRQVVAEIRYSGGKCAEGTCSKTETIYSNGTFTNHKELSSSEIESLKDEIEKSDLNRLEFIDSSNCPSAVDGQDISYSFPDKYGETLFTVCQIQNAETFPLIKKMNTLVANK